jgi:hypothetical protein
MNVSPLPVAHVVAGLPVKHRVAPVDRLATQRHDDFERALKHLKSVGDDADRAAAPLVVCGADAGPRMLPSFEAPPRGLSIALPVSLTARSAAQLAALLLSPASLTGVQLAGGCWRFEVANAGSPLRFIELHRTQGCINVTLIGEARLHARVDASLDRLRARLTQRGANLGSLQMNPLGPNDDTSPCP